METTIGSRIKTLRNHVGLSMAAFGDVIQMTNSNISKMEKDLRAVTDRTIAIICHEFKVNEEWLRTGKGEMFINSETFSLDEKAKEHKLSELEIAIMRGYMELDHDVREAIVSKLEGIIQQRSECNKGTTTVQLTPEQIAAEEAEKYRLEMLAELKGETSLVSEKRSEKSSS